MSWDNGGYAQFSLTNGNFMQFILLLMLAMLTTSAPAAAENPSQEAILEELRADRQKWEAFSSKERMEHEATTAKTNAMPPAVRDAYKWCNDREESGSVPWVENPPPRRCPLPPGARGIPNETFYTGLKGISLNIRMQPGPYEYPLDRALLEAVLGRQIKRDLLPYVEQDQQCNLPPLHIVKPEPDANNLRAAAPPVSDRDDTISVVADVSFNRESSPPSATIHVAQYRWRADCRSLSPHKAKTLHLPLNLPRAQVEAQLRYFAQRLELGTGGYRPAGMEYTPLPEDRRMWPMLRVVCAPEKDLFETSYMAVATPHLNADFRRLQNPDENPVQVFGETAYYRLKPAPPGGVAIPACVLKDRTIGIDPVGLSYTVILTEKTATQERRFDIAIKPRGQPEGAPVKFDEAMLGRSLDIRTASGDALEFCWRHYGFKVCVPAPRVDGRIPDAFELPAAWSEYVEGMTAKARAGDADAQAFMCRHAAFSQNSFGYYGRQGVCLRSAERGINYCRLLSKADGMIGDLDMMMREIGIRDLWFKDKQMEPVYWCLGAAQAGDSFAQFKVGDIYRSTGHRDPGYYKDSMRWLRAAADQGEAGGLAQYAQLLTADPSDKTGIDADFPTSFALSLKAAEQGNGNGMWSTAYNYLKGMGTPVNYEESYFWYSLIGYGYAEPAWHLTAEQVARVQKRVQEWQPVLPEKKTRP